MVGEITMGENTKKYLGIGLIAVGVGLGGYAIYSHVKKKDRKTATPALSGVGKKSKKSKSKAKSEAKSKSKSKKRTKKSSKRKNIKRILL